MYHVMTSAYPNKSSWKWQHRRQNVAIVETISDCPPCRIDERIKDIVSIPFYRGGCYVGSSDRCQFAKALQEAEELCDQLNNKRTTS